MKRIFVHILVLVSSLTLFAFQSNKEVKSMVKKEVFGKLSDGKEVYLYTLTNSTGAKATITNFGARVVSLLVPDRDGKLGDVVTGFDNIEGYVNDKSYFGAIVGRYGNRIGKGQFTLDGKSYQLDINDGQNHLHGGSKGFFQDLWTATEYKSKLGPAVKFSYTSPDGEMGYPGTVKATVIYILTDKNELQIQYTGKTDKPTIFNPTHHSYFNLSGDFNNTILDEELSIDAESITPVDETLITTGKITPVENTPMDFRKPTKIGLRIAADYDQLKFGKGYDHNWVLNNYKKGKVRKAATVYDSRSGRVMEVLTDQPGLQFYSGNFMDGTLSGKGFVYKHRTGLCLEAQCYPDTPNKPQFPSCTLNPGEVYKQKTIYRFSTK